VSTTRILGISAYYHDSAAALIENGAIVAAAQEERFTRKKHDPSFPAHSIMYCLQSARCSLIELDTIIFYDKPLLKFERLLETYLGNAPRGISSCIRAMPVWLKEKLYLKSVLRHELKKISGIKKSSELPQLLFSEHHLSHAGSAFYPSPFREAAVLCLDGVGEWATSSAWYGNGCELAPLWEIQFPHSLGLLYSAFTYYTGFKVNSGEYKLMGLAPYGDPKYVDLIMEHLISVRDDGSFALDMSYFNFATGLTMTNHKFHALFGGPPRHAADMITQKEMDIAHSIQVVTEEIVLNIVAHLSTLCSTRNLCLAGGVALNCVANGRILKESLFDNIWIQPAAGDAGGSLGAALVAWHQYHGGERFINKAEDSMMGAYLGPQYSDDEIVQYIEQAHLHYSLVNDETLYDNVAELITSGKVIGWFQGRMEFGPRALGNRSILGDPRKADMQNIMNIKIKERESFRPFAPAVLGEDVSDYFEQKHKSPYMLLVAKVKKELRLPCDDSLRGTDKLKQRRSTLPAVTHVDHSARIQTVHKKTNPRFHQLLQAFKKKTQCAVLINTSFNVRGEPPVCSPEDAVRCFLATDIDYLIMGNVMLDKKQQKLQDIERAKSVTFNLD